MGLFSKQLLEVIEWKDDTKDTIVYRYPITKREEIMNSSTLVVRPSQTAIFVHKGQIADIFAPGTYKLATENIPVITKMLSLPTGFNSTIKAEVYFVNTKQFTALKRGTSNPIMLRDPDFGNVRLRAFGTYSFKVVNVRKFMEEVLGTSGLYKVADIEDHNRPLIIQGFTDVIGEGKFSALDLAANYKEVADKITAQTNPEFLNLGMKLVKVVVENISLPEEIEKALDETTRLGMLEQHVNTYTRLKAADALSDAAKNEGGGLAGLGVALGAGASLGKVFAENVQPATTTKSAQTKVCADCQTELPARAKFCPGCGKAIKIKKGTYCTNCGAAVTASAKFCPECGRKVGE